MCQNGEWKEHCNAVSGEIIKQINGFTKRWDRWTRAHTKMAKEQAKYNEDMRTIVNDHEITLYGHSPNKDRGINAEAKKIGKLEALFSVGVISIIALVVTTIINMAS